MIFGGALGRPLNFLMDSHGFMVIILRVMCEVARSRLGFIKVQDGRAYLDARKSKPTKHIFYNNCKTRWEHDT